MDISPLSILQNIAGFKSQMIGSLFGSNDDPKGDFLSALAAQKSALNRAPNDTASLLPQGSKLPGLNLFDTMSAHKLMTSINSRDVLHKAEFSEMYKMKDYVQQMEDAGDRLSGIIAATPNSEIQTQLQSFVAEYNGLVQQFKPSIQNGGLLAGVQAAEISLYELEQSVKYKFFGAKEGLHGMGDLGITIDPSSKLATLDSAKLDAVLSSNKLAAVNTLHEFSSNFSKSADLLNSNGNFIPNRLNNLSRAISYIANNKESLQAEFGIGDAAKPNSRVAQALAAYNQIYGATPPLAI